MAVMIKRIYEPAAATDGLRVLVDRLWPRGIKKTDANLAYWMKDVAPSPKLRVWFDHRPERFKEFGGRYKQELKGNLAVGELRKLARRRRITLLYAARDPKVNHAVVLAAVLRAGKRAAAAKLARTPRQRVQIT